MNVLICSDERVGNSHVAQDIRHASLDDRVKFIGEYCLPAG
jgi:hypothetical protein